MNLRMQSHKCNCNMNHCKTMRLNWIVCRQHFVLIMSFNERFKGSSLNVLSRPSRTRLKSIWTKRKSQFVALSLRNITKLLDTFQIESKFLFLHWQKKNCSIRYECPSYLMTIRNQKYLCTSLRWNLNWRKVLYF